jgi:Transglycosylase SLT domain
MRILPLTCILVAITVAAICQIILAKTLSAGPPSAAAEAEVVAESPSSVAVAVTPAALSAREPSLSLEEKAAVDIPEMGPEKLEQDYFAARDYSPDSKYPDQTPARQDLPYVVYYVYSELPPERKPADIVLDSLKGTPIGTPLEEIKRAADAFGLDFSFMRAVAKIESDFDPKQRTGSYVGLFQLNNYEFAKYGSGEITNPRDNAIAAAYKFVTEAVLFEMDTHKKPTFSDLYLIHQQGWQGAAEHVSHPERIAWKSMCATDEGREKGDRWCKRAVWGNTLPAIKHISKSVDNLTSGAFVHMWRERVDHFYSRYSEAIVGETKH